MKQYKHKITGDLVYFKKDNNSYYFAKTIDGYTYNLPKNIVENSYDWIEVIQKDYEILSFTGRYDKNDICKLWPNGLYGINYPEFTLKDQLEKLKIYNTTKK
jgi:expansin (peptidoglycan-binding protein)